MSRRIHRTVRIARTRRWQLYVVVIGVWFTGGIWLQFHYFMGRQGDFGPLENPLTPWWLRLHGAFAFAAIWIFGLLWGTHVATAWPRKRRRWSGGLLAGIFLFLIVSGYLLYYVGDDRVRPVLSVLHWGIGLVCPVFFFFHRLRRRRQRNRNPEPMALEANVK